jgi:formylglycine-generating enzyme required for sulfatase activity
MSFARLPCSLVLPAAEVLDCQRSELVTPEGDPSKTDVSPAFRGSKAGDEREVAGIKLCWCPPGKFVMGSPASEDQVEVTLSKEFWTGKYEVTQGQWKRVGIFRSSTGVKGTLATGVADKASLNRRIVAASLRKSGFAPPRPERGTRRPPT